MTQGWARLVTIPGVLLGFVVLWWWGWSGGPRLRLVEVDGTAILDRPGAEAPVSAHSGLRLQADDHVTTGKGSRAVLQFGESTQIEVGPTSSFEVAHVDEEGLSLELEDGAVRAIVRPDSGQVRIRNQGRGVVTNDAVVDVGVRDEVLEVRALEGSVELEGTEIERISAGEAATVVGRRARVARVPSNLLLSIDPPVAKRTAAQTHAVKGRTAPAADVVVRGPAGSERVRADAEGRFEVDVELVEGDNQATVESTDVFGATASVRAALPERDTQGPVVRGEVAYPQ